MMLKSMKKQTPVHISLDNFVTNPSLKMWGTTFWPSGQGCQKCVYILLTSLVIWSKSCHSDIWKMAQQQNNWGKRARGLFPVVLAPYLASILNKHSYNLYLDFDECGQVSSPCGANSRCINKDITVGTIPFECKCSAPYISDPDARGCSGIFCYCFLLLFSHGVFTCCFFTI